MSLLKESLITKSIVGHKGSVVWYHVPHSALMVVTYQEIVKCPWVVRDLGVIRYLP